MKKILSLSLVLIFLVSGCQNRLIQNPQRLSDIQRMLKVQKQLTSHSKTPIWDIFNQPLTQDERQAMEFLYAYMPLSDLADYNPQFFLGNVRESLKARKEMPWGKSIPEDVFLHFVLPVRVNNENLDSFRIVMYPELKERIKGMSMREAALEINHWCHEKVTYRGTDSRTSAPLSTIKKSFGRCGEESTFTVAAMRTAGIPARQVYTPRWAHSDDNHAWVEVWINNKWYFLGACEPDVDFNMGWFKEPSRRAMMVHTRAYGRYYGNEPVVIASDRFSELNLTSLYAPVKTVAVTVKNPDGTPADSARVEFRLYNYAEYYPIATNYTNKDGMTNLTTGMGDLLVWTARKGCFAWSKLSVSGTDTLKLQLQPYSFKEYTEMLDMVPPHAVKDTTTVSPEAKDRNNKRLAKEDSIRNAYMATFKDSAWAAQLAGRLGLSPDTVIPIIKKSYGNWKEMSNYFEKNVTVYRPYVLAMASQLADKDYSDARESILTSQLKQALSSVESRQNLPNDIFVRYVLAPRIALENLSTWRSFLWKEMGSMAPQAKQNINVLTDWIQKNIKVDAMANMHSRAPISPEGVYNLGVADELSRNIFFVAACRTFGIPARLNPETSVPEYMKDGEWLRAGFTPETTVQPAKGYLHLTNVKSNPVMPVYYLHFTIAQFRDGFYRTMDFDEGMKLDAFPEKIALDTGHYMLVTGNRMEDGSVLSSITFFDIRQGKLTTIPVQMRLQFAQQKPSGKLDLAKLMLQSSGNANPVNLENLTDGKDAVIVLLDPDKEPSKHVLNDLGPYVDHFNKWGGAFIFAMPAEKSGQAKVLGTYALPSNKSVGIDMKDNLLEAISAIYGPGLKDRLPLVLLCNKKGEVFFFTSGYQIGIGEQLLKKIPVLDITAK